MQKVAEICLLIYLFYWQFVTDEIVKSDKK